MTSPGGLNCAVPRRRKRSRRRRTVVSRGACRNTCPGGDHARLVPVEEQRLPGGNAGGAVLVGGTVRRPAGPWAPSVHALLRHLEARGSAGAPRVLGLDDQDREMLSYLPGETVGIPGRGRLGCTPTRRLQRSAIGCAATTTRWRTSFRPAGPGGDLPSGPGGPGTSSLTTTPPLTTPYGGLSRLTRVRACMAATARGIGWRVSSTGTSLRHARRSGIWPSWRSPGRIGDHASSIGELATAGDPLFTRLVRDGVIAGLDRAVAELAESAATFEDTG
ncbi:MAG: hypothetical protein QOG05_2877 [Streptosporangiaceae bacterium]|nr:hypothetical protein [Streptosporangiaceae bacterium]